MKLNRFFEIFSRGLVERFGHRNHVDIEMAVKMLSTGMIRGANLNPNGRSYVFIESAEVSSPKVSETRIIFAHMFPQHQQDITLYLRTDDLYELIDICGEDAMELTHEDMLAFGDMLNDFLSMTQL